MNWSEKLGALPEAAPPRDAWPEIRARLERRRRLPGAWPVMSMAAALMAGLALWLASGPGPSPETVAPSKASPWVAQSQQLESDLRNLETGGGVMSGGEAALITELEDRIAMVDLQLAGGSVDSDQAERLWQRRVDLLMELKAVRTDSVYVADSNSYVL